MLPNAISMTYFGRSVISQYVNYDLMKRQDLYSVRDRLNIFPGFSNSIATVLELSCLESLYNMGVGFNISQNAIRSPIYAAFIDLAINPKYWNIEGDAERKAEYEKALFDVNVNKRRSNIQELFDIQSRDAFRYLCVDSAGMNELGEDMSATFTKLGGRAAVVIDAHNMSQPIKDTYHGHLFTVKL